MFAELDGVLVAVDHRGKPFESNLYNRAIHLLMLDVKQEIPGITKIETEGPIESHLW